jgi:hypothetical protein
MSNEIKLLEARAFEIERMLYRMSEECILDDEQELWNAYNHGKKMAFLVAAQYIKEIDTELRRIIDARL